MLQASEHSEAGTLLKRMVQDLQSPSCGLRTPPELACPSEALTHIQSQAGRAAAVAAATLDTEQTLEERAQYCELADTERRAFWVHRNAREVLCQASAEAEQQGGPHMTLQTLYICSTAPHMDHAEPEGTTSQSPIRTAPGHKPCRQPKPAGYAPACTIKALRMYEPRA